MEPEPCKVCANTWFPTVAKAETSGATDRVQMGRFFLEGEFALFVGGGGLVLLDELYVGPLNGLAVFSGNSAV